MAIAYVSNALGGTTTTTTFSITLPATQAGDILILEFAHRGTGDGTIGGTYTGPAFALKHSQLFATSLYSGKTYWSRATGDHSGQTVTGASLINSCAAVITVYRGALASGDPLADATIVGEQNASGNETQAQITTGTDGAEVCLVVVNSPDYNVSSGACTSPGALTERAERLSTGGTDTSVSHWSGAKASAGATGAFTWAQTNAVGGSWAYAIKPEVTALPTWAGSAIATAARVSQGEDTNVSDWTVGTPFIIGMAMYAESVNTPVMDLRCRWRNVTDVGSFAELAATGELDWTGATDLVNGNGLLSAEALCTSAGTFKTSVEREGANAVASAQLNSGQWSEIQWAVGTGNALAGKTYTFQLYDATSTETLGPSVQIAFASSLLEAAAADGIKFGDADTSIWTYLSAVVDGAKFGDAVTGGRGLVADSADGVTFADASGRMLTFSAASADGVAVSDAALRSAIMGATVADGMDLSDADLRRTIQLSATIDGLTFTDSTLCLLQLIAAASDGVRLSDASVGDLALPGLHEGTVAEGVTFGDGATAAWIAFAAAVEGLKLGDATAATLRALATAVDGAKFGDTAAWEGALSAVAADGIKFGDSAARAAQLLASSATGIKVGDGGSVVMTWNVQATDGVSLGESVGVILGMIANAADGMTLADSARTPTVAVGAITVTFTGRGAAITFTARKPGPTFAGRGPGPTFDERKPDATFTGRKPGITFTGA